MGPSQRGRGDPSIHKALMPLAPCLEKAVQNREQTILALGSNKKSIPRHQPIILRAGYGCGSGCKCSEGIRKAFEKPLVAKERTRLEA